MGVQGDAFTRRRSRFCGRTRYTHAQPSTIRGRAASSSMGQHKKLNICRASGRSASWRSCGARASCPRRRAARAARAAALSARAARRRRTAAPRGTKDARRRTRRSRHHFSRERPLFAKMSNACACFAIFSADIRENVLRVFADGGIFADVVERSGFARILTKGSSSVEPFAYHPHDPLAEWSTVGPMSERTRVRIKVRPWGPMT